MSNNIIGFETDLKLNLNIESISGYTMDDYDFVVEVYCRESQKIEIFKKDAIRIDANNYVLLVNTKELGTGSIRCKVVVDIPDKDFSDGYRKEVVFIQTGLNIIKSM